MKKNIATKILCAFFCTIGIPTSSCATVIYCNSDGSQTKNARFLFFEIGESQTKNIERSLEKGMSLPDTCEITSIIIEGYSDQSENSVEISLNRARYVYGAIANTKYKNLVREVSGKGVKVYPKDEYAKENQRRVVEIHMTVQSKP